MYKALLFILCFFFIEFCYSQDNQQLKLMYEEDQSARQVTNIDWPKLIKEDCLRQMKLVNLIRQNKLTTANDYFHAAMIFQHGNDSSSYKMACDYSKMAFQMDTSNTNARWLSAASYDRYLISIGKPQIYGTQFVILDKKYYLQEIDTTIVTDSERIYYGTQTLQEIKKYLTEKNGEDKGLLIFKK